LITISYSVNLLKYLLLDIENATSAGIDVRTEGGDQNANPPEVVVSWAPQRLEDYAGHRPPTEILRDADGNANGKRYQSYFEMNADILVRHTDEFERDKIIAELHDHFVPYEADPSIFSKDTAQWRIGVGAPRGLAFVEPDWYESGIPLSFVYKKDTDVTDSGSLPDTIESIDIAVNDRTLTVEANNTYTVPKGATRYFRVLDVYGTLEIDGTVYTQQTHVYDNGNITISDTGELVEADVPYDEIDGTNSKTII